MCTIKSRQRFHGRLTFKTIVATCWCGRGPAYRLDEEQSRCGSKSSRSWRANDRGAFPTNVSFISHLQFVVEVRHSCDSNLFVIEKSEPEILDVTDLTT